MLSFRSLISFFSSSFVCEKPLIFFFFLFFQIANTMMPPVTGPNVPQPGQQQHAGMIVPNNASIPIQTSAGKMWLPFV